MLCGLSLGLTTAGAQSTPSATDFFQAIRDNRLDTVRTLLGAATPSASVNVRDKLQVTPLHYAAIYGSYEAMKLLVEHGADVNALDNRGDTPLVYAAYSLDRTKLLVEHGANVQVAGTNHMTPLDVAAGLHGNTETLRYLLDHGAKPSATPGADFATLAIAAEHADPSAVKLLLERGADPRFVDSLGQTALFMAVTGDPGAPCTEKVDLLLDRSDVNALNTRAGMVKNGPIALTHMSALMWAVQGCDAAVTAKLIKAGARVNEHDVRQMTPLMLAVATDHAKPAIVGTLLSAGADVSAKDAMGETAMDWALKYRNPAIVNLLERAKAPHGEAVVQPVSTSAPPSPQEALQRSAALLNKTALQFWPAGGGCVACHSQTLTARAYVALRDAGAHPPEAMNQLFRDGILSFRPRMMGSAPFLVGLGGDYDGPLSIFDALADVNAPPSDTTDVMLHYIACRQSVDGSWSRALDGRPPLEGDSISRTASAIRALRTYGWGARQAEFAERIARARRWLLTVQTDSYYAQADRLMGLYYAGASDAELKSVASQLIAAQRKDGGWAQTAFLDSDAYATGFVLYALRSTKQMSATDPIYKSGVNYLLRTQMPDGSWYVRSRALKLQPYFQSGFPYDHDQWISNAATAWAATAIAPAYPQLSASLQDGR